MAELKEFSLFSNLPVELRLKCWNTLIDSIGPRIVELRCDGRARGVNHISTRTWADKPTPPAILQLLATNHEARYELLRRGYKIMFQIGSETKANGIWFNPEIDTLFLGVEARTLCEKLGMGNARVPWFKLLRQVDRGGFLAADCAEVKHLAVEARVWRQDFQGFAHGCNRYDDELAVYEAEIAYGKVNPSKPPTPPRLYLLEHFIKLTRFLIVGCETKGMWSDASFKAVECDHDCKSCKDLSLHRHLRKENDEAVYISEEKRMARISEGGKPPPYLLGDVVRPGLEQAMARYASLTGRSLPKVEYYWKVRK